MKRIVFAVFLCIFVSATASCASDDAQTPTLNTASTATSFPMATQAPPPTPATSAPILTQVPSLRPPQPIPRIQTALSNPYSYVSPSIDQQILDADVIAVASFVSATAGVQTLPGDTGVAPTYRPMQILTFRAAEYLKGTGPTEFTVEVLELSRGIVTNGDLYTGYLTQQEALAAATDLVSRRDTAWDDRPGVIFLKGPLNSAASNSIGTSPESGPRSTTESESSTSSNSTSFRFVLSNRAAQSSFAYSINTLSRTWLPAMESSSSGTGAQDSGTNKATETSGAKYITDGAKRPHPAVSLPDLRARIAEIDTLLAAGAGIEGYEDCVYLTLVRERYWRAAPESKVWEIEVTIDSGLAAQSVSLKEAMGDPSHDALSFDIDYFEFWTSGSDAGYFQTIVADDDEEASNGYSYTFSVVRPLPEGEYNANFHLWSPKEALCNTKPTTEAEDTGGYSNWTVTVTAPAGTLHEAFFDPVTVGTAVKADGSNGVLKPTSFTVGGTATELTSLEWSSNQVVLTLNPHVSLSGQVLDFIGLDGNITLSLLADEATANSTAGTYTWTMSSQPWADGDKLMLRIRPVGTEIFLTNLPSSMVQGVTHWFMVNLTNLNRSRSYSYRLSADNADVAFHNSACHSAPVNVTVSAGETSYARQHALLGCGTPGATATATLMEGTTEVDTTTYSVTVTPPPPPSVAIESLASSMEEGENDQFVINASHLDTAHGHTIRLTTDNANMGFDAECTDREEDLTVGRGSAAYVDSRRLYGCTAPGGTLTVTLLQGETVVDTTTYDVEVTPPPPPSVEFLNSPYTLESGGSVVVRMRVSNLDADSSYTIRVSPDNANLGYNQDCTSREFSDGTSGRNSFSTFFTLYGCASPGGTLTATLLEGTTE